MEISKNFEERTYRKVDWRLIPFLFLCYILAYLDRVNLGFAKLQMLKDLSLSEAAFATGAGIFFIGYFFFEDIISSGSFRIYIGHRGRRLGFRPMAV
jgi:sugar phosphate permease